VGVGEGRESKKKGEEKREWEQRAAFLPTVCWGVSPVERWCYHCNHSVDLLGSHGEELIQSESSPIYIPRFALKNMKEACEGII